MKKLLFTTLLLGSLTANAASFSFTGTFEDDNSVQLFDFSVDSPRDVTIRTWSYAGGTNSDGNRVFSGGFDPIISLANDAGALFIENDDGSGVAADPNTGNSYDSLLMSNLAAGNYTVAVTQFANFAKGPNLADGFGDSFAIDFDGRTNFWALDIDGAEFASLSSSPSAVPVPAALWLFGSGLAGLVVGGNRKKS